MDTPEIVLDDICKRSAKKNMAAESTNPEFFGLDESERNAVAVSPQVRAKALESCAEALEILGYEISTLIDDKPILDGHD